MSLFLEAQSFSNRRFVTCLSNVHGRAKSKTAEQEAEWTYASGFTNVVAFQ